VITRCDYCGHSEEFNDTNGNCTPCGAPLPKPAPRLIERTFNISRGMIDATSFNSPTSMYVPGITHATAKEITEE
jgi:hypothetical protein